MSSTSRCRVSQRSRRSRGRPKDYGSGRRSSFASARRRRAGSSWASTSIARPRSLGALRRHRRRREQELRVLERVPRAYIAEHLERTRDAENRSRRAGSIFFREEEHERLLEMLSRSGWLAQCEERFANEDPDASSI